MTSANRLKTLRSCTVYVSSLTTIHSECFECASVGLQLQIIVFRFYICCDRCQDWFHGRCVGILQSEADNIDEYICPRCQRNSSVNFANMKDLSQKDFEALKKLIKQLQVSVLIDNFHCSFDFPVIYFRPTKVLGRLWNLLIQQKHLIITK